MKPTKYPPNQIRYLSPFEKMNGYVNAARLKLISFSFQIPVC